MLSLSDELRHLHGLCLHPLTYTLSKEAQEFYKRHPELEFRSVLEERFFTDKTGQTYLKHANGKLIERVERQFDGRVVPCEALNKEQLKQLTRSVVSPTDEEKMGMPPDLCLSHILHSLDVHQLTAELSASEISGSREDPLVSPMQTIAEEAESHLPLKKRRSASTSTLLLEDMRSASTSTLLLEDMRSASTSTLLLEDVRTSSSTGKINIQNEDKSRKSKDKKNSVIIVDPIKFETKKGKLISLKKKLPDRYKSFNIKCMRQITADIIVPHQSVDKVKIFKRKLDKRDLSPLELADLGALLNQKRTKALRQSNPASGAFQFLNTDANARFASRVQVHRFNEERVRSSRRRDCGHSSNVLSHHRERLLRNQIHDSEVYDKKSSREQIENEFDEHMRSNLLLLFVTETQCQDKAYPLSHILNDASRGEVRHCGEKNPFYKLAAHNHSIRDRITCRGNNRHRQQYDLKQMNGDFDELVRGFDKPVRQSSTPQSIKWYRPRNSTVDRSEESIEFDEDNAAEVAEMPMAVDCASDDSTLHISADSSDDDADVDADVDELTVAVDCVSDDCSKTSECSLPYVSTALPVEKDIGHLPIPPSMSNLSKAADVDRTIPSDAHSQMKPEEMEFRPTKSADADNVDILCQSVVDAGINEADKYIVCDGATTEWDDGVSIVPVHFPPPPIPPPNPVVVRGEYCEQDRQFLSTSRDTVQLGNNSLPNANAGLPMNRGLYNANQMLAPVPRPFGNYNAAPPLHSYSLYSNIPLPNYPPPAYPAGVPFVYNRYVRQYTPTPRSSCTFPQGNSRY